MPRTERMRMDQASTRPRGKEEQETSLATVSWRPKPAGLTVEGEANENPQWLSSMFPAGS